MNQVVGGFARAFGSGLAIGLGKAIALIIVIAALIFVAILILGIIGFIMAIIFYRKKRKIAFLVSSIISLLSISLIAGIILSSNISHDASLVPILTPILFLVGLIIIIKKYKKLGASQ